MAGFDSAAALSCDTDGREPGGLACDSPDYTCSEPPVCPGDGSYGDCGSLESSFDGYGCLRSGCRTNADCGPGKICHRAPDDCRSSTIGCADGVDAECTCLVTLDCGGGRCLDLCEYGFDATKCEEAVTKAQCEALAVEPQSGRECAWVDVEARTNSCADTDSRKSCVGFQLARTGLNQVCPVENPPTHYRELGGTYLFLSMASLRPVGWSTCGDAPETDPPGCACC